MTKPIESAKQEYKKIESENYRMHGVFTKKCTCGKEFEVRTQPDEDPEYYTDVFVKCDCGSFVLFSLPVN